MKRRPFVSGHILTRQGVKNPQKFREHNGAINLVPREVCLPQDLVSIIALTLLPYNWRPGEHSGLQVLDGDMIVRLRHGDVPNYFGHVLLEPFVGREYVCWHRHLQILTRLERLFYFEWPGLG